MKYCKKCVQPDTRPGIVFKDGVCGACLWEDEKKKIDWSARERALADLAHSIKIPDNQYDCVLGVSGGKDSTYASLYAKEKLGLRCLLVNSEPEGITEIGKSNIENLINLGFDVFKIRPNPQVMKAMVRRDFYKFLNPVKITEYSLWSSAYIIADKFNIPLMIQGENPALLLGVANAVPTDDDALNADKQNTLADGWKQYEDTVSPKDLYLFHYDRDRLSKKTRAIWLNYYDKDWSPRHNAEFSKKRGLKWREDFNPEDFGTYVPWAQMDSNLVQVNQMFKYYKFGFGQCTDYACYDIRDGIITREQGFELVEKYDGKCGSQYIEKFCKYIDITEGEMWRVVGEFVDKSLFYRNNGRWEQSFRYI
jgi:N-acetyl sugar amidotransferase